ncbi:hypothetical protein LCER1_G001571 [Lachnellula cervina]|uniref:DUF6594 domain-containing protein n=1 Tax=Lachnellula cervina TaxID=1316786 RepID=A0A7D8V1E2_9HELO|nr:hypothetical protein LCER1_G001571 [Lachnellula cervina]
MTSIAVATASPAQAFEELPLTTPRQGYAANDDRAEQGDPSREMQQPGIRNRGVEERVPRNATQDDEPRARSAQAASAPADDERTQEARRPLSLTAIALEGVRNLAARAQFSRQTKEERDEYNKRQGYDRIKYDDVHHHPEGLAQLACFMNSNDDWAIFRRFGYLSTRALNQLQIELTDLEKELNNLDDGDAADPHMRKRLRGYEGFPGWNEGQLDLLSKIRKKLSEFYELLLRDSQVRDLGKAPPRHYRGLFNWVFGEHPLCPEKEDFIFHAEDFVSVAKHSDKGTPLAEFIQTFFDYSPESRLKSLFQTDRELSKSRDRYVDYYSPSRLNIFVKAVTVSLAIGMLLIPVMLLFLVPMSRESMAWLVFGFVMVFAATLSVISQAKVQDILVGTSA